MMYTNKITGNVVANYNAIIDDPDGQLKYTIEIVQIKKRRCYFILVVNGVIADIIHFKRGALFDMDVVQKAFADYINMDSRQMRRFKMFRG